MKKRIFLPVIIILAALYIFPTAAGADMSVNLGTVDAGESFELLIANVEGGASVSSEGSVLPEGCAISSSATESGITLKLVGQSPVAGSFSFALTVLSADSAVLSNIKCALQVMPAEPTVSISEAIDCSLGDAVLISVSTTTADRGTLSYRWFSNTENSTVGSAPLAGQVSSSLSADTSVAGSRYYYCEVTNTNNGFTTAVLSPIASVTVKEPVISSISLGSMPTKTEYIVGEALDSSGLSLKVSYEGGYTETLQSGFGLYPLTLSEEGTQEITVSYKGLKCTFPVTVKKKETTIRGIELAAMPDKTEYILGDWLDTSGIKLRVDTGDSEHQISTGFTCTPTTLNTVGRQYITIHYNELSCGFYVTVSEREELKSIELISLPTKTVYTVGEKLDTSGLRLKLIYNTGERELNSGFSYRPTLLTTEGEQQIELNYEDKVCTFSVTVTAAPVTETEMPDFSDAVPKPSAAPVIENERPSAKSSIIIIVASVIVLAGLAAYIYYMKYLRKK